MKIIVVLVAFVAMAAAVEDRSSSTSVVNTTASLINESVNQIDRDTGAAVRSIDLLQSRYADKLDVVNLNDKFLQNEIKQLNAKLDLWGVESSFKKACVDKYRSEIPAPQMIHTSIDECVASGRNKSTELILSAKAIFQSALSRKSSFMEEAENCVKHQIGIFNETTCLMEKIDSWRQLVNTDLMNLENELDTQTCLSNSYVKVVQQCVSNHITGFYGSMNKASYKIERCFEDRDGASGACSSSPKS